MKYRAENAVSSFFHYMGTWSEDECKTVFGGQYRHFWKKWCAYSDKSIFGAAEQFYAELSENNRKLLAERATMLYDGEAKREKPDEELVYVCNTCGFILYTYVDIGSGWYTCMPNEDDSFFNEECCAECSEDNCCTLKDFKEKMQAWWNSCDARTKEHITGLKEHDSTSGDGPQESAGEATEWWNSQSYDRKRDIYIEYNF